MTKRRVCSVLLTVWTVIMMTVLAAPAFAAEKTLYVSPVGNDDAAGTAAAPLATLTGAKERAKTVPGPLKVLFRAGTYPVAETVAFDENDRADVTYAAYPGERVVFTAGAALTGFEEGEVNGVAAFRLNVGDMDFNVLFSEARMLTRPRYPESGYLTVKRVSDSDVANPGSPEDFHRAYVAMTADPAAVPALKNEQDTVIRILHYWKDEMLTVRSFDRASGRIEFSRPTSMQVRENDRFFLENVFSALDQPGEWYLDRAGHTLWYVPYPGEDAASLTLWASDVETMVSVDGADGIRFEGIVFRGNGFQIPCGNTGRDTSSQAAYDANACLRFENAANCGVKNCEFRDIAGGAVYFGANVQNAEVNACVFENVGAQAVFIRGENLPAEDARVTRDITVTNNLVSGYGRTFFNAVGVLVIHAAGVEVSHNEIRDGYYTAISCGWVWGYGYTVTDGCRITDNLIYNIGQGWLSDMGGIYMLGVQPHTVISGNVIHNVAADPGEGGYGGWGIYLDEGSSRMTVEKNLVYACGSDAYHLHYGADNTVRNNIFALSSDSVIRAVSRYEDHKTADFTKNILLTSGKTPVFSALQKPGSVTTGDNVLWDLTNGGALYALKDTDADRAMSVATAVRRGYLGRDLIADPLFRDAAAFDFALDPASPAIKNGFETWNYANAGTLPGSVIGTSVAGGETAYNAFSRPVPYGGSRERLAPFMAFINRLYSLWLRFLAFFDRVC